MVFLYFCEGAKLNILFNVSKSCVFTVGIAFSDNIQPLKLGSQILRSVAMLKYLGVFLVSKYLNVGMSVLVRKCYEIKQSKNVSDDVKLRLTETFVLPALNAQMNLFSQVTSSDMY